MVKSIDKDLTPLNIGLNGKVITAVDAANIGLGNFRSMINLRPGPTNPEPIQGMTKINTAALANPNFTVGIQFTKDDPTAESHVIVHAKDANNANGKVYRNGAVVPAQGAFTATQLFSDSAGAGTPRFSLAPLGSVVYCNGVDSVIWPGLETKCVGFIDYDPANSYRYNYLRQVTNDFTDSNNLATLHRYAETVDDYTITLLHLDNNVTDDMGTPARSPAQKTVTNVGSNVTFSTTYKKHGTHGAVFNGTNAYLTIPDHTDFNFTGGNFTAESFVRFNATSGKVTLFYQQGATAADYIHIYASGFAGLWLLAMKIVSASATVLYLASSTTMVTGQYYHLEASGKANGSNTDFRIYINGTLADSSINDSVRPANYTSVVYIGVDNSSGSLADYANGYMDEIRFSSTCRHTGTFEPPTQAYGQGNLTSIYVASPLPLEGINWYVQTANTVAGSAVFYYHDGSTWVSAGTITGVGATPFSTTGKNTWTFASTASTAKQKVIDGGMAYWYKVEITNVDTTTQIYQVTLDCAMQQIRDLWDGSFRRIASFLKYSSSTFNDLTTNVFEDSWDSSNTATFAELDSLATATDYLVFGFTERQTGLRINIIGGHGNSTAGTIATVYYCNGVMPATNASAWTSVGTIDDGTMEGGISFAKSGIISWDPPELANEFQINITSPPGIKLVQDPSVPSRWVPTIPTAVGGVSGTQNLYYYKVVFSQNLSADVQIYFAGGIPVQTDLKGYDFSFTHLNRLWLARGNKAIASSQGTSQVFNGDDALEFEAGDNSNLVAAASLTTRLGNSIYALLLLFKKTGLYVLIGSNSEDMVGPFKIADIGITAPETLAIIPSYEVGPGISRPIAVWQSSDGIYMSDGFSVNLLSQDIADRFDDRKSTCINRTYVSSSFGSYDERYNGYHWCYAEGSATAPDQEWVYRFGVSKWFEIDRTAAKRLKGLIPVRDTSGNSYMYGLIASGYMERLENGPTFDGVNITYSFWPADLAIYQGDMAVETKLRGIKLVCKANNDTANTIAVTHYVDGDTTGKTVPAIAPQKVGRRTTSVYRSVLFDGVTHSTSFSLSSDLGTVGFEPLYLSYYFRGERLDKGMSVGSPVT